MDIEKIQLYVFVKTELDRKMPSGYSARLIELNPKRRKKRKCGFRVELRSPLLSNVISTDTQLAKYCRKYGSDLSGLDVKFRYFMMDYQFEYIKCPKERSRLLFRYARLVVQGCDSLILECCGKSFGREDYLEHRKIDHPFKIIE